MSRIAVLAWAAGLGGLALAADVGLGWFAGAAGIPFSLDVVGTATAGAARGALFGLVVGLAGGGLVAAVVPGAAPHGAALLTHAIVGLAAAGAGRVGALRSVGRSVAVGGAVGLATALAILLWLGGQIAPLAVFLPGEGSGMSYAIGALAVAAEVIDKAAAFALACVLLRRLPAPMLAPGRGRGASA